MIAFITILWFIGLLATIVFIRETARMHAMVCMFPRRLSLVDFSIVLGLVGTFCGTSAVPSIQELT